MNLEQSKKLAEELGAPFPEKEIQFKVQNYSKDKTKGRLSAYVDARAVQERLNEVLGVFGWSNSYSEPKISEKGASIECKIIAFDEDGTSVERSDVGTGDAGENMIKSAYSDSFKRAGVHFGIGRQLYQFPKDIWVELNGKFIKDEDKARKRVLTAYKAIVEGKPVPKEKRPATKPEIKPEDKTNGTAKAQKGEGITDEGFDEVVSKVNLVLDGKWDKIISKFEDREDYKAELENQQGDMLGALYQVMTQDEGHRIVKALDEFASKRS